MLVMFVVFVFVLAVKFTASLVTSVDPMTMIVMPRHPDPLISTIPIARDTFVKTAIADIDIKADRVRGWF